MTITEAVTTRIANLLKERKMTKKQFMELSGIPIGTLSSLHLGIAKGVSMKTLYNICKGFNMSLSEFVADELFAILDVD